MVHSIDVSIIVPVFNQWPFTEACLKSLNASAAVSSRTAEILLADDGSVDETGTRWQSFEHGPWPVRYHRNPENLGFVRNCNAAARRAQGRYLCFLNNDVEVPAGWLDALVETLESSPDIGAVGPVFLDAFGQILECGSVVHSDGTAKQLGRGASLKDRRYLFRNDVDYVSGACLVLRTDSFWKHGGFDERYVPCYYEDTDLCLKLAEEGLRVLVDPRVRIVHYEGSSNGADTSGGLKRYQEINRDRFFHRWKERLLSRHSSAEEELYDRMRIWRRKRVIVCHTTHLPSADDRGRIEPSWAWLAGLIEQRCHVVLVSPNAAVEPSDALHAAGIETVQAQWGGDRESRWLVPAYRPMAAFFADAEAEREYGKSYAEFSPDTLRVYDASSAVSLTTAAQRESDRFSTGASNGPAILTGDELNELASAMRSDVTLVASSDVQKLLTEGLFFDRERVRIVDRRPGDGRGESRSASARSVETSAVETGAGGRSTPVKPLPALPVAAASISADDMRVESVSDAALLLEAIGDARELRKETSRWTLATRLLWHARGYPGAAEDFQRTLAAFERQLESQRALVEQYRLTLHQHRTNETRLARELYKSLGASRKLLQRS